ncbi:ferredoxin-NADP reductase [Vibrio variabilis]|uniref:ferredoxin--NADP(+) reductase n=1 Tax=Vibrio variabilis TaxID=990271 RepID=A0ABR4YFZ7_9VIBR|nr:ferredoxin--NADP reductase [Vibrio variabilis]KHA61912.1 ferredoxin-NADP reductase [Vibrio variabilis]
MAALDGFSQAHVERRTEWTSLLFSLRLGGASVRFQAGQYVKLALLNQDEQLVARPYSIVNAPLNSSDMMEFLIVANPEGSLSPLLQQLREGDTIYVSNKAYGDLTLSSIPKNTQNLWLLATGTGIGPFLSLLDDINVRPGCDHIVLVHAVRQEKDLVYRYLIETLIEQYDGRLQYVPVVSREQLDCALYGRIPQLLSNQTLQKEAGVNLSAEESFVMLCGNPDMIKESVEVLKSFGLEKHRRATGGQIIYERYW